MESSDPIRPSPGAAATSASCSRTPRSSTATIPPNYFRDVMLAGHFRSFEHEHFYVRTEENRTVMRDGLRFSAPFGVAGSLTEHLFLRRYFIKFLQARNAAVRRFAESPTHEWRDYLSCPKQRIRQLPSHFSHRPCNQSRRQRARDVHSPARPPHPGTHWALLRPLHTSPVRGARARNASRRRTHRWPRHRWRYRSLGGYALRLR